MAFKLGLATALLLWAAWIIWAGPNPDLECPLCTKYLVATMPVFRIVFVPIAALWTWALCVRLWEKQSINYIVQPDDRVFPCDSYGEIFLY